MADFRVGKPRLRARVGTTYSKAGGHAAVVWGAIDSDEGNGTITPPITSWTCPRTGLYLVSSTLQTGSTTGTPGQMIIELRTNGAQLQRAQIQGTTATTALTVTTLTELNLDDVLEVYATLSTAARDLNAPSSWSIVRLGPERWT